MTTRKRRPPIGQSIGGVLFGFEQQVFRNQPPPHELVHHARPDVPVPAGDGSSLTFELPPARPGGTDPAGAHTGTHQARVVTPEPAPGGIGIRPAPEGWPEARLQPPVIAEPGDPFAALRVLDAVARMDRGRPIRLDDLVDRLNAADVDWLFARPVVVDALVALQSNWMADYRNASGILLEEGERGPTVTLEDSSRVDPWLTSQARRLAAECRRVLDEFARRDRPFGDG